MLTKTRVVNIRDESYDIYIGRGTIWGNPYKIGKDGNREEVIELYRKYLLTNQFLLDKLPELKNKVLGCHCKPYQCHGDVLVELINKEQLKNIFT